MTNAHFTAPLASLGLLAISGEDRLAFLQGQLTNDVRLLSDDTLLTAGWCSPKGRLLTIFRLFTEGDTVYALAPRADLPMLLKRLRMFVLRSHVTVTEVTDRPVIGLWGDVAHAVLPAGTRVLRTLAPAAATGLEGTLAIGVLPDALTACAFTSDENAFWSRTTAAGEPWVFEATRDQFVPQAVNLELVNGVSFKKGCYTGQEIVSRVEHIGRTPRRAALFVAEGDLALAPGTPVATTAGEEAALTVLSASDGHRTWYLLQTATDAVTRTDLAVEGTPLVPIDLPYSYSRTH